MSKFIFILILFFPLSLRAQELISPIYISDSVNHEINFNFKGYYHNNSLTNEFLSLFYTGGHIDTSLKNSMSEKLFTENRIGAELTYGVRYKNFHSHLLGKPEWGWYASAENIGFYHGKFSENAFQLLFYGNSRFTGDTVELNDVSFESFQYQKFTFGGFHKNNHSYIGVSFLKGQNYNSLNIDKANLYTAPLGEEISLDLHAGFKQSDTTDKSLTAFNGWGLSTDMVFYLNMGKNKNVKFENAFRIAIQDLGFIKWNKGLYTEADSNYYFNGFEVDDLFDSTSYNFSDRLTDSLSIAPVQKSITTILPFSFSFSKIADPASFDKFQGMYGFRMRAFSNYKPLFYAGIFYQPLKNLNMNLYASVGGYGKFRIGYSLYAFMFNKARLSIASSDLIGWTKNGNGKDLSIQLSYDF